MSPSPSRVGIKGAVLALTSSLFATNSSSLQSALLEERQEPAATGVVSVHQPSDEEDGRLLSDSKSPRASKQQLDDSEMISNESLSFDYTNSCFLDELLANTDTSDGLSVEKFVFHMAGFVKLSENLRGKRAKRAVISLWLLLASMCFILNFFIYYRAYSVTVTFDNDNNISASSSFCFKQLVLLGLGASLNSVVSVIVTHRLISKKLYELTHFQDVAFYKISSTRPTFFKNTLCGIMCSAVPLVVAIVYFASRISGDPGLLVVALILLVNECYKSLLCAINLYLISSESSYIQCVLSEIERGVREEQLSNVKYNFMVDQVNYKQRQNSALYTYIFAANNVNLLLLLLSINLFVNDIDSIRGTTDLYVSVPTYCCLLVYIFAKDIAILQVLYRSVRAINERFRAIYSEASNMFFNNVVRETLRIGVCLSMQTNPIAYHISYMLLNNEIYLLINSVYILTFIVTIVANILV